MRFLLHLHILSLSVCYVQTTSTNSSTNLNITIQAPGNTSSPAPTSYKSIHVQYTLPNNDDRWNIVEITPLIRKSNETVQQLTVHLCQLSSNVHHQDSIWYDDETNCHGAPSMLIYQWAPYSFLSAFRIADDLGFQLDKSKSIVLTITYAQEQQSHRDRLGIILYISSLTPRFYVGTLVVGNNQRGTRFSCRSLNYPRLLYAIKPLFRKTNAWWRIYAIRNRNFGRKAALLVLDSSIMSNESTTDMEHISPDVFLIPEDYLIVECEPVHDSTCRFLVYYTYKNVPSKYFTKTDNICPHNDYPDLFKLLPSKSKGTTIPISPRASNIDATTILLLICVLLIVIWISIIAGCVIMRRIRGLVNFRSEPSSPMSSQNNKQFFARKQGGRDHGNQKVANEGDQIAQLDIEHMGLMS